MMQSGAAGRLRSLELYLRALWGAAFEVRAGSAAQRRPSFAGYCQVLPGGPGPAAASPLDFACAAHAAAHAEFSGERFLTAALKPIQRVLVSLFEDARVEALARRRYPGLGAAWARYHVASVADGDSLPQLLARLARALSDPHYVDPDSWVQNAQAAFFGGAAAWAEPASSRALGVRFGNDLGQMRRPFDARGYVVEPSYRDDHSGLWQTAAELSSERARADADAEPAALSGSSAAAPRDGADASSELARTYPEWDYVIGRLRDGFCSLIETTVKDGAPGAECTRPSSLERRGVERALALLQRASERQRRALAGEQLDCDALVRLQVERARGGDHDGRVYVGRRPMRARVSVLFLLDLSSSLVELGAGGRFARLRELVSALPARPARLELAVDGFSSAGRNRVDYRSLSAFGELPRLAVARLGQRPAPGSTRLGAALRHAARRLARRPAERRLLLVVTDAELADIDVFDERYLIEDARHAVHAARASGVEVFGLVVAASAAAHPSRIFGARGRRGFAPLGALHGLPSRLRHAH